MPVLEFRSINYRRAIIAMLPSVEEDIRYWEKELFLARTEHKEQRSRTCQAKLDWCCRMLKECHEQMDA
jgi:predicted metal-binding transcription factor (methanogenesis marker protein 9)